MNDRDRVSAPLQFDPRPFRDGDSLALPGRLLEDDSREPLPLGADLSTVTAGDRLAHAKVDNNSDSPRPLGATP